MKQTQTVTSVITQYFCDRCQAQTASWHTCYGCGGLYCRAHFTIWYRDLFTDEDCGDNGYRVCGDCHEKAQPFAAQAEALNRAHEAAIDALQVQWKAMCKPQEETK